MLDMYPSTVIVLQAPPPMCTFCFFCITLNTILSIFGVFYSATARSASALVIDIEVSVVVGYHIHKDCKC